MLKSHITGFALFILSFACFAEPDITSPGPELPTFPENVNTLPAGNGYIELSAFGYVGSDMESPGMFNTPFLLEYGATDNIELRIYDNGFAWNGTNKSYSGFQPPTFGALIHVMDEQSDIFLPAIAIEPLVATNIFGNSNTRGGVQPIFLFTFVNTLPFEIEFNYTLGTIRAINSLNENYWQFEFQWALQKEVFECLQLFIHGSYNSVNLSSQSLPALQNTYATEESVIGAGFIFTANERLAFYGQISGGVNPYTPSIVSWGGFAISF